MNGDAVSPLLVVILVLAAVAAGLAVWAMAERGRAERAILEASMLRERLEGGTEALETQAALSAAAAADALAARTTESFAARERLVQARLERS